MLQVGDKAPDFSLPSADMQMRSLSDCAGKWFLLYWGCYVEFSRHIFLKVKLIILV